MAVQSPQWHRGRPSGLEKIRRFAPDQGHLALEAEDIFDIFPKRMERTDDPSEIVDQEPGVRPLPGHATRNGKCVSCFRPETDLARHWSRRAGSNVGRCRFL